MKQTDAHTAAAIAWDRIIETGSPLAVLLIQGVVRTADPSKKTGVAYIERYCSWHIGTYNQSARVRDMAADILDFYCQSKKNVV